MKLVVFSNLLSLHLSSVQIFSSVPCSQTPSVYVPYLIRDRDKLSNILPISIMSKQYATEHMMHGRSNSSILNIKLNYLQREEFSYI
jgi:hypothetical protein